MKKLLVCFMAGLFILGLTISCKKKDDSSSGQKKWQLTVNVDLGGQFSVLASADIIITGTTFTAAITTTKIAGVDEVHNISLQGAVTNGNTLNVSNQQFNVTVGTDQNQVMISTATCTISGNSITGSGNIEETITGVPTPVLGTFTLTGQLN